MKALILAAGRGSRMEQMTRDLPKCLAIQLNGKSLLDIQLETLASCGITETSLVRGYQAEKISRPGIRYFFNEDYQNNNILESLFCAEEILEGDILVSYSDIWYEADIIRKLCQCQKDIAIGVDMDWRDTYKNREGHPIEEAEMVVFNHRQEILKIGKIAHRQKVHGEFIGIMKLTQRGCGLLRKHYVQAKALYEGKPFQRASTFKKAYLTDLLQEMADNGIPIHCESVGHHWREIDTIEDFNNVKTILGDH